MTYGICMNYEFTRLGQEAVDRGTSLKKILNPRYNGIYWHLFIETAESKYEPLLEQLKKDFRKNQNTRRGLKDLEDIVEVKPQRRYVSTEAKHRPRDKKYHSQS